jgi:hypothetical protein
MLLSCAGVQTVGGRVEVCWAIESAAKPWEQLAYFIEFLTLARLWSSWQESYPLTYISPECGPPGRTFWVPGCCRYLPVTGVTTKSRCDGVNPALLGMNKIISEDALRGALKRIQEEEGTLAGAHLVSSDLARLNIIHCSRFTSEPHPK